MGGAANGGDMKNLKKGVAAVKVNGKLVAGPWNHSWMMEGEEKAVYNPESTGTVSWQSYSTAHATEPLTWHKAHLDLPKGVDVTDSELSFALDLSSMWKGIAYVNGFNLGRYWLRTGVCNGVCAPPVKNGHCYMHWKDCGKPTQSVYHIPSSVLKAKNNLVVLFEETTPEATRDPLNIELLALKSPQTVTRSVFI